MRTEHRASLSRGKATAALLLGAVVVVSVVVFLIGLQGGEPAPKKPAVHIIPYDPAHFIGKTGREARNALFELDSYNDNNRLVRENERVLHNPRHLGMQYELASDMVAQLDSNAFVTQLLASMEALRQQFRAFAADSTAALQQLRRDASPEHEALLKRWLSRTTSATLQASQLDGYLTTEQVHQLTAMLQHPVIRDLHDMPAFADADADADAIEGIVGFEYDMMADRQPVLTSSRLVALSGQRTLEAWQETLLYRLRQRHTVVTAYFHLRSQCKRNFCSTGHHDDGGMATQRRLLNELAPISRFKCEQHLDDTRDMYYQSNVEHGARSSDLLLALVRLSAALYDLSYKLRYTFGAPEFLRQPVATLLHCNDTLTAIGRHFNRNPLLPLVAPSLLLSPVEQRQSVNPFHDDNVALVVSFRDRAAHLEHLLQAVRDNESLRRFQRVRVFVVEEQAGAPFNRGKLFNAGFEIASAAGFDQFVFHDVDMIPTARQASYAVRQLIELQQLQRARHSNRTELLPPVHMSTCVEQFDWKLPYTYFAGGNIMFTAEQFRLINGFSNRFWSWGGEDDDLWQRVASVWPAGPLRLEPHCQHGRFESLDHTPFIEEGYQFPCRLFAAEDLGRGLDKIDGLSSLVYERRQDVRVDDLLTHVLVEI